MSPGAGHGTATIDESVKNQRSRWGICSRALRRRLSAAAPTLIVLALLEVVLRIGASIAHGGSQYYLLYGLHGIVGRVGISPWWVYDGGYYKFPPNHVLKGAAGQGDNETASINSLGFRGPEFQPRRLPRTFRIITLGESSTFGFHNTDTGTYPYQLEQSFRGQPSSLRVEVINAGFPYYNSGSIRALLEKELAAYDPDLITLYSAYNDTSWPLRVDVGVRALIWIQQHSAIYLVLKEAVLTDQRVYKLKRQLAGWLNQRLDTAIVEQQAEHMAARYRGNVTAIAAFARQRGIPLVLIRQPMTAHYQKSPTRAPKTYEEEYRVVRRKLADGGFLSSFQLWLIIHYRLIQELDAIAREQRLPIVDNIAIVDQDRSRLKTWVHLTEEANAKLAEALKATIEPFVEDAARRAGIEAKRDRIPQPRPAAASH